MAELIRFPAEDDRYWHQWLKGVQDQGVPRQFAELIIARARERCAALPSRLEISVPAAEGGEEEFVRLTNFCRNLWVCAAAQIVTAEYELLYCELGLPLIGCAKRTPG
jgi:hypothetical protein